MGNSTRKRPRPCSLALTAAIKISNPSLDFTVGELKDICRKSGVKGHSNSNKQGLFDLLGLGSLPRSKAQQRRDEKNRVKSVLEDRRSILIADAVPEPADKTKKKERKELINTLSKRRDKAEIDGDVREAARLVHQLETIGVYEINLKHVTLNGYNEGSEGPTPSAWKKFASSPAATEKIQKHGGRGANCLWRMGQTTGEPLAVKEGKNTYFCNIKDLSTKGRFLSFCKSIQVMKELYPEKTGHISHLSDWRDLAPEHIDMFYNKDIGRCVLKGEEIDRKTTSTLKHLYVWICQQREQQLL